MLVGHIDAFADGVVGGTEAAYFLLMVPSVYICLSCGGGRKHGVRNVMSGNDLQWKLCFCYRSTFL